MLNKQWLPWEPSEVITKVQNIDIISKNWKNTYVI